MTTEIGMQESPIVSDSAWLKPNTLRLHQGDIFTPVASVLLCRIQRHIGMFEQVIDLDTYVESGNAETDRGMHHTAVIEPDVCLLHSGPELFGYKQSLVKPCFRQPNDKLLAADASKNVHPSEHVFRSGGKYPQDIY